MVEVDCQEPAVSSLPSTLLAKSLLSTPIWTAEPGCTGLSNLASVVGYFSIHGQHPQGGEANYQHQQLDPLPSWLVEASPGGLLEWQRSLMPPSYRGGFCQSLGRQVPPSGKSIFRFVKSGQL